MKTAPRPAPRRADRAGVRHASAAPAPPRGGSARPGFGGLVAHPALWSAIAAVLIYLPTLGFGFVWDDHALIETSGLLSDPKALGRLLAADYWEVIGGTSGFWRPLVTFSYWLDGRLLHASPAWFHVMNVAAHGAASALVVAVATQSGIAFFPALLGGLWFATIPAHVESVAWISGRTDVFCAVFMLSALWLDRRARHGGRRWSGMGALLMMAAALLSKETAVGFVAIIAIAELTDRPRSRFDLRRTAAWLAPYVAILALYVVLHAALVGFKAGGPSETDPVMVSRIRLGAIASFWEYLRLLLPGSLHVPGAGMKLPLSAGEPAVWLGAMLELGLIAWMSVLLLKRSPAAIPFGLWWLGLLPLTMVALTQGRLLFGELHLYLPSAGVAWLLALALDRQGVRGTRVPAFGAGSWAALARTVAVSGLVLSDGIITSRLLPAWKNDEAVAQAKLRLQPGYAESHSFMAQQLLEADRDHEAEQETREALLLDPELAQSNSMLAVIELRRGLPDSALVHARRALAVNPALRDARLVEGMALLKLGRTDEAAPLLEKLIADYPDAPGCQAAWGNVLLLRNRAADALPLLEHSLADANVARSADVIYQLGMARAQLGQMPSAREAFARAVALEPRHYEAWLRLALASFALGDGAGCEAALESAAALPQAADGRVEKLRHQIATAAPIRPPGGAP